jgi:hypothetical protein
LTPIGRVAFRLGLHHRFVDHLPESVMARLRKFRTSWYTHKFQSSRDAS